MKRLINWFLGLFKKKENTPVPPTPTDSGSSQTPELPKEVPTSPTTPGVSSSALSTSGNKIMRDGKPFTLRGVNIPDPYVVIDKPWEPDGIGANRMIAMIKNSFPGINVIRLPCMPYSKEEGNSGKEGISKYGPIEYWNNILNPMINEIRSQLPGCYIIIDYHPKTYDAGLKWTSWAKNCVSFWTQIAPKLTNYQTQQNGIEVEVIQDDLILEIANEPIDPRSFDRLVAEIYNPALKAIRAAGCTQLCLIGNSGWSSDLDQITKDNWVKDSNSAVVYHAYANQGRSQWEANAGHALSLGIPVCVTETGFGVGETEGGTLEGFGRPFTDWMEERGISYTFWCFSTQWQPRLVDNIWKLSDAGNLVKKLIERNV